MAEDRQETGLTGRPRPPQLLFSIDAAIDGLKFVSAPDLVEWISATFLEEDAPLRNEDHQHLAYARIGALWTTVPNGRAGRTIIGMAEFGQMI
jgi:hypothetical protein